MGLNFLIIPTLYLFFFDENHFFYGAFPFKRYTLLMMPISYNSAPSLSFIAVISFILDLLHIDISLLKRVYFLANNLHMENIQISRIHNLCSLALIDSFLVIAGFIKKSIRLPQSQSATFFPSTVAPNS
jgi:hypothetical protein